MTWVRNTVLAIVFLLAVSACDSQTPAGQNTTATPASPTAAPAIGTAERSGYVDVVDRVSPSVVTLQLDEGLGSGVVLRSDVVVTNAHVVGDQRSVTIVYADGVRTPGTVLATDTVTDLAVVRTQRDDLPVPEYRTDLPRPGEVALAIGSPLGFENSVSAGIVSGLHRDIPGSATTTSSLVDLIQTDASISPGNSGGALFDEQGRVIGINEAYIPPSAGAVSLGFAIPSATVLDVAEQLLENGRAEHPYLGVSVRALTDQIRRQLDVGADAGAVVMNLDAGGPVAEAGLQPGDVIVEFAGMQVRTVEDLLTALRQTQPGQQQPLTFSRGGNRQQVSVTVDSRAA